jgi:hypothetical protein
MWLISVLALIFFVLMFFTNWRIFYYNYVRKDSVTTVVPLLGGGAGMIALWILPIYEIDTFWVFVPLFIEWGSFPLLLVTGFLLIRKV